MSLSRLWIIAYRDLGRNRRRSLLSLLAVALGLALLIVINCLIAGVTEDALQNSIRLQTGHVQLRAASYSDDKVSLQWKDLLADTESLVARASAMPEVKAVAPVLWASAVLNTKDESVGLRVIGIDTTSALYAPIQSSITSGVYLAADDRSGVLIGKRLADNLGLAVDQKITLSVINADGQADEGLFTIRGLFATGVPSYDESAAIMPLAKAQALTRTDGHASAIVMLMNNQGDSAKVAAALGSADLKALTWEDLNALFIQTMSTGMSFYLILDAIVMLVVAVIVANTLLMAVFERIREMGILAALGMKGRQIVQMFLFEAANLGIAGVALGILLGSVGVLYLVKVGIPLGDITASTGNIALGTSMHARFAPGAIASLSIWTLIVTLLASLYPAWFAARLEPIQALHSQ